MILSLRTIRGQPHGFEAVLALPDDVCHDSIILIILISMKLHKYIDVHKLLLTLRIACFNFVLCLLFFYKSSCLFSVFLLASFESFFFAICGLNALKNHTTSFSLQHQ